MKAHPCNSFCNHPHFINLNHHLSFPINGSLTSVDIDTDGPIFHHDLRSISRLGLRLTNVSERWYFAPDERVEFTGGRKHWKSILDMIFPDSGLSLPRTGAEMCWHIDWRSEAKLALGWPPGAFPEWDVYEGPVLRPGANFSRIIMYGALLTLAWKDSIWKRFGCYIFDRLCMLCASGEAGKPVFLGIILEVICYWSDWQGPEVGLLLFSLIPYATSLLFRGVLLADVAWKAGLPAQVWISNHLFY